MRTRAIIDSIFISFCAFTDYESPIINETDYQQPHPFVRSGYSYRPRDRARYQLSSFGSIVTQGDRNHYDYVDDRDRESDVNFYDNKYYDNVKMHRWVMEEHGCGVIELGV